MTWAVSLILSALLAKGNVQRLTPDGQYYTQRPELRPYVVRRLLPWLLKDRFWAWKAVSFTATAASAALIGAKCGSPWYSAIVLGLPAFRCAFRMPVLTDPMGLLCLSASFYTGDWRYAALGGIFNEKAPVFGALLTSPMALVGLLPPFALYMSGKRPHKGDPEWLRKPLKCGLERIGRLLQPEVGILPWGGALLGFPFLSPSGWWGVLLGYGQLVMAQDGPRLFQWAALPVIAAVPAHHAPLAAALCWINPYRDTV